MLAKKPLFDGVCPLSCPFKCVNGYSTHPLVAKNSNRLFGVRSSMLHRLERILVADSEGCQIGTRRRQLFYSAYFGLDSGNWGWLEGQTVARGSGSNVLYSSMSLSYGQVYHMQSRNSPGNRYQKTNTPASCFDSSKFILQI